MQPRKEKPYDDISPSKDALNAAQIWPPGRIRGQRVRMTVTRSTNRTLVFPGLVFLFLGRSRRTRLGQSGRICVLSLGSHQVNRNYLKRKGWEIRFPIGETKDEEKKKTCHHRYKSFLLLSHAWVFFIEIVTLHKVVARPEELIQLHRRNQEKKKTKAAGRLTRCS
ncbi:hypothetical protein ACLKA7_005097 [Drosophila subpalustris]